MSPGRAPDKRPLTVELARLGDAMRSARVATDLSLRGMELVAGDGTTVWKFHYLSKIERGLEAPSEDLVRYYEQRCRARGKLLPLYREARAAAQREQGRRRLARRGITASDLFPILEVPDGPAGRKPFTDTPLITELLQVTVHLDRPQIEVIEARNVRAVEDGVDRFEVESRVLTTATGTRPPFELLAEEGCEAIELYEPTPGYRVHVVRFPRPLKRDEPHRFVVKKLTDEMKPRFVLTRINEVEQFQLRIVFPRDAPGVKVYRVDGWRPSLLQDVEQTDVIVELDSLNTAELLFTDMRYGLTYGALWSA